MGALLLPLLAALILMQGQPLAGGTVSGAAVVPLERAEGGDTPVLTLNSPRGPLRLLLDSGASSSMVTPALVRRLGLVNRELPASAFRLAGGGEGCGELRPGRTRLPRLELGTDAAAERLTLQGIEALVLPVGALPAGIDGVLGAPTLRRMPFWIDPSTDRLAFGAAALREAHRAATAGSQRWRNAENGPGAKPRLQRRLALRWHQGVPQLTLQTPAGGVAALADTGAEGLVLSHGLAARLPIRGEGRQLRLVGFCGEQRVQERAIPGLRLAGEPAAERHATRPPAATLAIIAGNSIFDALGVEAIVGQELLRGHRQLWRLEQNPPWLELD